MPPDQASNDHGGSPNNPHLVDPNADTVDDAASLMRQKETLNDYNCRDTADQVRDSDPSVGTGKGSGGAVTLAQKDKTNGQNETADLVWKLVPAEVEVNQAETAEKFADELTNCVSYAKTGCGLEASVGPLVGPNRFCLQEALELDMQGYGVEAREMLQNYLEEMKEAQAMSSKTSKMGDLQQYFYMVSSSIVLSRSGTSTRQGKARRREKYHRQQHAVLQERRAKEQHRGFRNLSPNTARERKDRRARLEQERYQRLSQVEVNARRNRKQGWVSGSSLGTSLAALVTEQSFASQDTIQARNQLPARTQTRQ